MNIKKDIKYFIDEIEDYIKLLEHQKEKLEYDYEQHMIVSGGESSLIPNIDKNIGITNACIRENNKFLCRLQQILLNHIK